MPNSEERTYRRSSGYIHRSVAGSEVLISIGENIANFNGYIELNPSAAFLWDALAEPQTLGALAERLAGHFDLPLAQAQADTREFLEELVQQNMVTAS